MGNTHTRTLTQRVIDHGVTMTTATNIPSTSFAAALAAAKPADGIKLPADRYSFKVVSAIVKAGTSSPILRLDLDVISGRATNTKFAGRRAIKNQPLSIAAAPFVAALCMQAGQGEILASQALCEALGHGDEAVVRRFVGATLVIDRSYVKDSDEVKMDLVIEE